MNNYFPRMITLLRKEKRISQKQAAKELEISQALLSHYEKGIRECGLEFLVKIAAYYGVSCDYLLGKTNVRESAETQKEKSPRRSDRYTPEETKILRGILAALRLGEHFSSKDLNEELARYFKICIYKTFRSLYSANSSNPKEFFSLDPKTYSADLSASMIRCENAIDRLARGESVYGKLAAESAPELTSELMRQRRPEYAEAIESIIAETEDSQTHGSLM